MMFSTFTQKVLKALAPATLLVAGFASPAMAAGLCGLTTISGGTANVSYDPFGSGQTNITITNLVLSRVNGPGGQKTSALDFYIKGQTAALNGTTIVVNSATGSGTGTGFGANVFYGTNVTAPVPNTSGNTAVPGTFRWDFSGNNAQSDTLTVNMSITLPANLNLSASNNIPLDIEYACAGTGGGGPFTDTGTKTNAIVVNVTVLSALQASFVGTALDFGEIGTVTNATAASSNTGTGNYVRVQSSGVYTVELRSQNAFRLKHPTGSLANALERVAYKLKAFGTFYNNTSTPTLNGLAFTRTCARAGIGSSNEDRIYLQGTLEEGGSGKTPSLGGNYTDSLTVTITPQDISAVSANDCNAQGAL